MLAKTTAKARFPCSVLQPNVGPYPLFRRRSFQRDLRGLHDSALIAVGYDTLCRRSELVALRAEDVESVFNGDGNILIRRSKTDQAGEGRLGYLSEASMERIRRWVEAAGIRNGPLFRAVHGLAVDERGLHPYAVNRTLKGLARKAGVDPATTRQPSGHSMRVGAALDMVESGIDLVPIMHAGGWKSPSMVLRYTQQISLAKSGMARLHQLREKRRHDLPAARPSNLQAPAHPFSFAESSRALPPDGTPPARSR